MSREFSCSDKETLIAYIYGECEAEERRVVELHLASCASCTGEVGGLGGVRQALAEWAPPAESAAFRIVREEAPSAVLRPARWWNRPLPAWASAAAAVLLLAGGAALANLDVRYGADGLTLRTGWQHDAGSRAAAGPAASAPAPWRADLAALERQLRGDFGAQLQAVRAAGPQPAPAAAAGDERQMMTRVQAMIDTRVSESDQRWQRELADRVLQVQGEFGLQRRSDQVRMLQAFGQLQGQTGSEIAQQRQYINYLLSTVSQKK
jgi:pyruvate/2-oxoglutarate dehydrogenase complex dihydrolipoamide acyltransferase (E2) component